MDLWGFMSKHKPEPQKQIISNCREHFSKSISNLPNGTILLCDGQRAWVEVASLGRCLGRFDMKPSIRYNDLGDIVRIGDLTCGEKSFPVRGWSMPANYLTAVMRFDLACWVHGTLFPKNTFVSFEAFKPAAGGVTPTTSR